MLDPHYVAFSRELARLSVERVVRDNGRAYWQMRCSCGSVVAMPTEDEARTVHDAHVQAHVDEANKRHAAT